STAAVAVENLAQRRLARERHDAVVPNRPQNCRERQLMTPCMRQSAEITDARTVAHVASMLVRFERAGIACSRALRDLQELVNAEREALEVGDDLAVIGEWRRRPGPHS